MVKEAIIYSFLVIFLIVGIYYKKKVRNFKDYVLGVRPQTKIAMIATVVATLVGGGSTIGEIGMTYNSGMIYLISLIFIPISYVLVSIFVVPKIKNYYGSYSLPEVIHKMYGGRARKATAVIAYVMCIGALAMQVKALSILFNNILGYDLIYNAVIAFLIITVYTSIGGVDSVIRTDIIQFIIFMVILPIITIAIMRDNGGTLQGVLELVPKENYIKEITLISLAGLIMQSLLPDDSCDFIHRLLIGRNERKNRMAVNFMALITGISILMILIISGVALTKYPNIVADNALFVVVKDALNNEVAYGMFGVALMAIILSTSDSLVNTSSVIFVNDLISNNVNDVKKLGLGRIISFTTGIMAILIAIYSSSVIKIILFFGQLYSSAIFVPFFLGLFFKEKNIKMYWSSVIAGVVSFLVLKVIMPDLENGIFLISLACSLMGYLLASNKVIKMPQINISNILDKANRVIKENNIPINKLGYASLPISIFTMMVNIDQYHFNSSFAIDISIVVMGVFLAIIDSIIDIKSKWRGSIIILLFWFCFPFFSMYLYFCQSIETMFAFNFVITMLLLGGLYSWEKIIINLITGYIAATGVFLLIHQPELKLFIEKIIILLIALSYISLLSYVVLRTRMMGIKDYFEKRLESVNKSNIDSEKESAAGYQKLLVMMERQLEAKTKCDNIVKESDFNSEISKIYDLDDVRLNILNYYACTAYKSGIKYDVTRGGDINDVMMTTSAKILYSIIGATTEVILEVLERNDELMVNIREQQGEIKIKYKIKSFVDFKQIMVYQREFKRKILDIETAVEGNQGKIEIENFKIIITFKSEEQEVVNLESRVFN